MTETLTRNSSGTKSVCQPPIATEKSLVNTDTIDPVRIACFFSTSGHSGVDRLAHHLIPAMAKRGYRVDLLKVRRHGPELKDIPEGVRIIDLGTRHTMLTLPSLVRYLRRERPFVLLSDKDKVNRLALLGRILAATRTRQVLRSGITISVDLASRDPIDRWVQRHSMGWLYRLADQVLVPSVGAADDMAAYTGLPRDRILAVPPPIVSASLMNKPLPRPEHPWFADGQPPVVLGVGELCSRKDFETLVRAFARVRATKPCRLMILGHGNTRGRLLELARRLGVMEDFQLPGFVSQPYLYMAHSAMLVSASLWEGLSFVTVEALAVGTPAVCTDCPSGPREILQDGHYGPLVPMGDDEAMAQAIIATLEHPLPADMLREAAARFEIEQATTGYLKAMGLPEQAPSHPTGIVPGRTKLDRE